MLWATQLTLVSMFGVTSQICFDFVLTIVIIVASEPCSQNAEERTYLPLVRGFKCSLITKA